jgi:hypothetical protein
MRATSKVMSVTLSPNPRGGRSALMALRRVLLTAAFAGLGQRCLALGPATGRGAARASAGGARAPRAPPRPAPAPGPAEAAVEPTPTGGSADKYRAVTLRRGKARLFRDGSPLVYGGAINEPAASLRPSELVRVIDGTGETIGWGCARPDATRRARRGAAGGALCRGCTRRRPARSCKG